MKMLQIQHYKYTDVHLKIALFQCEVFKPIDADRVKMLKQYLNHKKDIQNKEGKRNGSMRLARYQRGVDLIDRMMRTQCSMTKSSLG